MAAKYAPSNSFLTAFLSVARSVLHPSRASITSANRSGWSLRRLDSSILPAAILPIPSLLESLWEGGDAGGAWDGTLQAVPKKKTSHMKKRHRQMAGKALKDVTALNKCSACGRAKRAHVLCPYCVDSIRRWFSNGFKTQQEMLKDKERAHEIYNEERRIHGQRLLEKPAELRRADKA